MARGINRQTLVGNLGKDAELHTVGEKNSPVLKLRVAATTGYEQYEHTEWFDVVVWGKRAEALAPYLTKGTRVYLEGETRTRSWEGDDGQARYRTEVVLSGPVGEIVLLGGPAPAGAEPEDDIPF